MRRLRQALLLGFLLAPAAWGEEAPHAARATVETVLRREEVYLGETFSVGLRLGWDADAFSRHAVPTFARTTDVALHVRAPALGDLPGAVALPWPAPPSSADATWRVAVGDEVLDAVRGPPSPRAPTWAHAVLERAHRATRLGEVVLPAPRAHYVWATRFREDFVQGRVALDPREVVVEGAPRRLRVLPLPAEGRPAEFVDAIGRFTLRAQVEPAEVAVGETLRLSLELEGEGNVASLEAPRLDRLEGFHLYGTSDDHGAERRTVRYDLVPRRADVSELPSISLAYFDPTPPAGYRTVSTPPLPLRLRPGKSAPPAPPAPAGDGGVPSVDPRLGALLVLGGSALVALLAWRGWRRRARVPGREAPGERRALAAAAFLRAWDHPDADRAGAFATFLGVFLDAPPAAVNAPDLAGRLGALGVPSAQAREVVAALEGLVETRYGGPVPGADVPALVRALARRGEGSGASGRSSPSGVLPE